MSHFLQAVVVALAVGAVSDACSGDGGTPPPPSPPVTSAQNPCPASSPQPASELDAATPQPSKTPGGLRDPDPRGTIFDVLWNHRAASDRGRLTPLSVVSPRATEDIGDVAVIQDEGDLVAPPNSFDIPLTGLHFVNRAGGGYDIVRIDPAFRMAIGDRVTLADDDSAAKSLVFGFNFYGTTQSVAFVNSDGNITFGEADRSSSDRNIARLVEGAPRVAPFLGDLDPAAGGAVFVRAGADAFTATWCGVRVFDSNRLVTMQTSLLPDGTVEMKYADTPPFTATDGIAAVSPGHTGTFLPVDLSTVTSTPLGGGSGAVGEWFAMRPDLDLVSLARKFYRTHADAYDQLVIWTDATLTFDAFAFEITVANEIAGIGLNRFDSSSEFGSSGRRLRSLVQMDDIAKFPADPTTKFLGENNTLSVLGQEAGHRWLAFLQFSDLNRRGSDALLGRDKAHWSFFFNSDASVMEGNRIEDLGGGSFKTVAAVEKYSLLDQYAMGLVRDLDVPPFFYVESPINVQPAAQAESAPRVGVTFNGTRRNVLINDVIEVMGPRQPSAADSPKIHRQAFLFVVGRGRTADPTAVAKIDRIRRAWETFFAQATDGRGRADTRLVPSS